MPNHKSDTRAQVATLVQQALALGPRKELRTTLLRALEIAQGDAPKELTQLHYDRLGRGSRLTDPQRPGLLMKCGKTGLKRWTYRAQADGRQREITLGYYPELSVAEARARWADMRAKGDMVDAKSSTTLERLVDHYVTWASENLRTWQANDRLLRQHLLPGREAITLDELDIDHLSAPITAFRARSPQQARKLRSAISGVLTQAKRGGLLPKGFAITPGMLPEVDTAKPRTWHPGTKDLRTFLKATNEMGDIGQALRLIALTGVRLREGVEMRWDEVEGNRWTIPADRMKAKRPHVVILSDAAMAVLDARRGNGSPYVFPSSRDPQRPRHPNQIGRHWQRQRAELGLPDAFTVHTLRKALATWVAESGGTRDIRDRLTAHVLATGIDAHYNQAELTAPAAEWWQRWSDHLAAVEWREWRADRRGASMSEDAADDPAALAQSVPLPDFEQLLSVKRGTRPRATGVDAEFGALLERVRTGELSDAEWHMHMGVLAERFRTELEARRRAQRNSNNLLRNVAVNARWWGLRQAIIAGLATEGDWLRVSARADAARRRGDVQAGVRRPATPAVCEICRSQGIAETDGQRSTPPVRPDTARGRSAPGCAGRGGKSV